MPRVFVVHGTAGYPEENWFPWLKAEVERLGFPCTVPQFPTPEGQTLESWFAVLDPRTGAVPPDSIVVGHSLGGSFALRMLEVTPSPIIATYCVAAPIAVPPIKNMEKHLSFIGRPFDWNRIRSNSRRFEVFHADNDPDVCLGNGEAIADNLGVKLNLRAKAGHFNAAAGFLKFPEILEMIKIDLGGQP